MCNIAKVSRAPTLLFVSRLCSGGQQLCPGATVSQPVYLYGHRGPLQQQTPAGSAQRTPPQRHRTVSLNTQPRQLFGLNCVLHHLQFYYWQKWKRSGTLVPCLFRPHLLTACLSSVVPKMPSKNQPKSVFVICHHKERIAEGHKCEIAKDNTQYSVCCCSVSWNNIRKWRHACMLQ